MFCRNCGNPLPDGARFCNRCGTQVKQPAAPAPEPTFVPTQESVPEPEPVFEPSPVPEPEPVFEPEPAQEETLRFVPKPVTIPEPEPEPELFRAPEPEAPRFEPRRTAPAQPVEPQKLFERPADPETGRALSPWAYFGFSLLFLIPVVGIVLLIVFSFTAKNVNLRNFARSYWCGLVLLLAIALILLILALTGVLTGPFDAFKEWVRSGLPGLLSQIKLP